MQIRPAIGQWYIGNNGASFEVVAIDSTSGSIEVQHFDGTVDEYDPERWARSRLERSAPPEDYSGSLDISSDDYSMASQFIPRRDWSDPLDFIDMEYLELDEI